MQDACGSVVNRLITANSQIEVGTPGHSSMPCPGYDIALTVPQFSGVGYAWMKDGVIIPSENDNVLNLNNLQLTDAGAYDAIITIGGCEVSGSIDIDPINCGGPLSVQLTSFSAHCDPSGGTVLNWKTASEINSMNFIVQKSADLVNWETVEVLQAKGFSSVTTNYTSLDRQPYDDVTYYQLIQRDIDGTEKRYSPISNTCDNAVSSEMKVYPNPTNGDFNISYYSDKQTKLGLEIMDINGRIVASETHQLELGSNTLFISENLVQGVYIIHVNVGNKEMNPVKLVVN